METRTAARQAGGSLARPWRSLSSLTVNRWWQAVTGEPGGGRRACGLGHDLVRASEILWLHISPIHPFK